MTSISQRTRVGSGGTVTIQAPELPEGITVNVVVFIESDEQDTTDYLLSTTANRQCLLDAIDHIKHRQDLVVITPEEWDAKYCL